MQQSCMLTCLGIKSCLNWVMRILMRCISYLHEDPITKLLGVKPGLPIGHDDYLEDSWKHGIEWRSLAPPLNKPSYEQDAFEHASPSFPVLFLRPFHFKICWCPNINCQQHEQQAIHHALKH